MSDQVLTVATQIMVLGIAICVILLFVGIGVLVIIHVCMVGGAFRRGFGSTSAIERGNFGSNKTMSQYDVEKLPCFDFKARDKCGSSSSSSGSSSPVDCAVCLDNFKVGDKCRLLPLCRHSFHAQCVDVWLSKTPICPICRSTTESSHFSESEIELRESQTTESGRFSEIAVELREGQTAQSDSGGVVASTTHLSDAGVEV